MPQQDNIKESQSQIDALQTSETKWLSSMCSESPDLEDVVKSSTPLPDSPNAPGSVEDTLWTPEALDPNSQVVVVEQPHARWEAKNLVLSLDNLETACRLSNSETSSTATSDSSDWSTYIEDTSYGILGKCYREYRFQMRLSVSRGYLLPFEIICLAFTIGCCFMGAYNWPLCPADAYIPRYVFFNGALATFSVCMEIVCSLWKLVTVRSYHSSHGSGVKYLCAIGFGWVAVIMTFVEMAEFYTMSYSFYRLDANYCNEVFYWFVHYKNIAFGVVMALTVVIYKPGAGYYIMRSVNG